MDFAGDAQVKGATVHRNHVDPYACLKVYWSGVLTLM